MRINTDGKYAWRTDLYDRVGDLMNENTRSGAVDASAQFTEEMISNHEHAVKHPDMTPEFAALLSTSQVQLDYRIESGVRTGDAARGDE